jgi:hypothetical protein
MGLKKFVVRLLSRSELTPQRDYAAGLDEIQRPVSANLKELGFRRQRRTYNRTTADGLVHVINFQAGPYPLGGYEIKGLRENLWGKFTVNVGVVLPTLTEAELGPAGAGKFHREGEASIRTRLGTLVEGRDVWWPIEPPFARVAAQIKSLLERTALPWLDRFPDHRAIVDRVERGDVLPGLLPGRRELVAAVAAHHTGDLVRAKTYFRRARNATGNQGNASSRDAWLEHVAKIARSCGLTD